MSVEGTAHCRGAVGACCSFTGAFHCPDPVKFCQFETITGIWQPEFRDWQFFFMLAIFPGLVILFLLYCVLCFPLHVTVLKRLKRWWVRLTFQRGGMPRCSSCQSTGSCVAVAA